MKELFDPITLNWFRADSVELNRVTTEPSVGKVFKKGFNDPTYRTFRIEFGEWGASLYDSSTIFKSHVKFNNLMFVDYDKYPSGLLDLNYLDKQNSDDAQYSQTYSAYRFLKNRNEDTRAEYLRQFILGLYEIQYKYPYIFQDISGIDLLNQFDSQRGQRLDKAEISVTCYEGLSLKMQTLMELYRKAAWDDVYQRWVLPLNMREFKMIIYVFERRTFHQLDSYGNFGIADFVADLPVYAFECEPCEFIIENHMKPEYSQQYLKSTDIENTTIKIQVKNVKTYLKNGLMRGDKSMTKHLLIYDLMDKIERQQTKNGDVFAYVGKDGQGDSLATLNSFKAVYLTKEMLLKNEASDLTTYGVRQAGFLEQAHLGENHPLYLIELPVVQYEWHRATVTGPDYWSSTIRGDVRNLFKKETWQEIGYKLLNVIVSGTTQIKVAPIYGLMLTSIFKNVLQNIEISPQAMYISYATTGPVGLMTHIDPRSPYNHRAFNRIENKINAVKELTEYDIDDPIKIDKQVFTEKDLEYKVEPLDKMTQLDDYKVNPMDEMTELDEYKVKPMDKLNVIDDKVNSLSPTFDNIQQTKYNPQDIETEIDPEHEQPGLSKEVIDESLHINSFYPNIIDPANPKPNMADVIISGDSGLKTDKDEIKVENIKGVNDNTQDITVVIDKPGEHEAVKMNKIDGLKKQNDIDFNLISTEKEVNTIDFNELTYEEKDKPLKLKELEKTKKGVTVDFNEIVDNHQAVDIDFKNIDTNSKHNEFALNEITKPGKSDKLDFNQIDEEQKTTPLDLVNAEKTQRNVAVNKMKTLDNVSRPPRSELISQLIEFDKEATKNEKLIQNSIIESNMDNSDKESAKLLLIFAENRDGFQESFANRVIDLKRTLIEQNTKLVKGLPDATIETPINRLTVGMATIEETERIKANAILTGLADEDIRKMSLSTLIALNDQLVESLDNTAGLNKRPIQTEIDKHKARDKRLIGGHVIEDPLKTK